jgi:hypothetical protein
MTQAIRNVSRMRSKTQSSHLAVGPGHASWSHMRHTSLASSVLAASMAFAVRASGDDLSGPTSASQPATRGVDAPTNRQLQSEPHLHDGFYLRLSTGLGPYNERIDRPGQESHASVNGIAHTAEVAAGTTIRPGVVLGAAFWSSTVLASSTRTFVGEVMTSSTAQNPSSWVAGPWIDYYYDPRGGLHIPAAFGIALVNGLEVDGSRLSRTNNALGAGMLLGLGYDWWISDQWSVGVLGRVTAIAATSQDDDGRRWFHLVGSAPSVLFSATYN